MKKKLSIVIIALICIIAAVVAYGSKQTPFLTKEMNFLIKTHAAMEQDFISSVAIVDDEIYVSLREICEKLCFSFDWDENKGVIEVSSVDKELDHEAVYFSEEGTLQSGRKYQFFGIEDAIEEIDGEFYGNLFDLQDYIVEKKLRSLTVYTIKKFAATPQEAAEIAEFYFALEDSPIEIASINVHYDITTDSWVLIRQLSLEAVTTGGGSAILVINRVDGSMKRYSPGR
jgi:predicted GH43/DUF377 family glycosyl hydrolase